jgi:hypothetical protein
MASVVPFPVTWSERQLSRGLPPDGTLNLPLEAEVRRDETAVRRAELPDLLWPFHREVGRFFETAPSGFFHVFDIAPVSLDSAPTTHRSPRRHRSSKPKPKRSSKSGSLDIIIEMELVRMRTQPDGIDLLLSLVVEPGFDHIRSEHIAACQERMIAFECIKSLVQRSGR